ncbi:MAG TPA: L,D-transpeptidase family protein [Xanthobacteraceae bacterium]|jgi:murein L,D-transpeptidase YcbB/YkuD|nr:L,D-transpeptidase family protein [Xanthobacteraceae bacterium]
MHGLRFGLLLASTAVGLVLAAHDAPAYAVADNEKAIEALVPVPDTTVPPPNLAPGPTPSSSTAAPPAEPTTTATVPAAQPAAALAEADQPVADKLREYLTGKADRFIDRKSRPAVETFYAARNYAPLWIDKGNAGERTQAVAAFLAKVDADGLDPADYVLPTVKAGADAAALAEAELKTTATVLTYARHAQIGRVHYTRISSDIAFNLVAPEPADVLGGVADTKDVAAALERFNPPHAGYKALKAKLAELRGGRGDAAPKRIEHGQVLKLAKTAMQDPRVPALRQRLGVAEEGNTTYDKPLADAVKKFQDGRGLAATGNLTPATIDALNGPKRDRAVDVILANMERWRWLPRDLGKTYVMVNIPDFTLKVVSNDATVWTTRIVTGQPGQKATPLLSETMKYITVNPTWNVPPSIINNEYLPALQQDPTALERIGLKVEHNRDGTVRIYQPPGERNALGRIRFNFPNKFLVYQHDTPDKHLFAKETRAYSHGCMRVQNPDKYAEVLLSLANPKDHYTIDRLHRMYGTGETDIHLQTPIPVHITYQTAYVDEGGKLVMRDDVYGRDAKYFAVMKGDEHRVADIGVENREASTANRPPRLPDNYSYANNNRDGSVFGWLFGSPRGQAVPRRTIAR